MVRERNGSIFIGTLSGGLFLGYLLQLEETCFNKGYVNLMLFIGKLYTIVNGEKQGNRPFYIFIPWDTYLLSFKSSICFIRFWSFDILIERASESILNKITIFIVLGVPKTSNLEINKITKTLHFIQIYEKNYYCEVYLLILISR